jgi:hypothetical protein
VRATVLTAFVLLLLATFPVAAQAQTSDVAASADVVASPADAGPVARSAASTDDVALRRAAHAIDDQAMASTVLYALSGVLAVAGIVTLVASWVGYFCLELLATSGYCDERNRAAATGEGVGGAILGLGVVAFSFAVGLDVDARHRRRALEGPGLALGVVPSAGGAVFGLRGWF